MKSIQVGNISEQDIKSILKNLDVNIYLKQNFILFICDKNDIESYKKEVIERFISRMRRDSMIFYLPLMLSWFITYFIFISFVLLLINNPQLFKSFLYTFRTFFME